MARQAIKIPKSFNTGNEGFVPLQTNRFAPQLYSNLIIAQESMGYSIAIQYVKKYILDRLPKNYLRSFHINGKHMFDDFRIFNKQNVKKEKPNDEQKKAFLDNLIDRKKYNNLIDMKLMKKCLDFVTK